MRESKQFIEEGMHSQVIIKGYREAMEQALKRVSEVAVNITEKSGEEKRDLLKKCA